MTYLNPVLSLLLLLMAAALRWKRRALAAAAVVALFLWSWQPFAWLVAGTLEWQTTQERPVPDGAGAIVVVSGNVLPPNPAWAQPSLSEDTYLRCHHAAWLQRQWPSLPVLASGGHIRNLSFSHEMAKMLRDEGVPAPLVWTEDRSSSTYENALYSARILREKGIRRIVLVTEAYHMPRTARCFRKQGLEVVEAPCEFRLQRFQPDWKKYLFPTAASIASNDAVLHEWVGMAWYRVSGKM